MCWLVFTPQNQFKFDAETNVPLKDHERKVLHIYICIYLCCCLHVVVVPTVVV